MAIIFIFSLFSFLFFFAIMSVGYIVKREEIQLSCNKLNSLCVKNICDCSGNIVLNKTIK